MVKLSEYLENLETPRSSHRIAKAAHREGIMSEFESKNKTRVQTGSRRMALLGGMTAAVMIFGAAVGPLSSNPLSAQQVLAQSQEAVAGDSQQQGRYRYSKERISSNFNGEEETFTVESWEDTEGDRYKSVTTDKDGNVIDTFVMIDGKAYVSEAPELSAYFDGEVETFEVSSEEIASLEGQLDGANGAVAAQELSEEEFEEMFGDDIESFAVESGVVGQSESFLLELPELGEGEEFTGEIVELDDAQLEELGLEGDALIGTTATVVASPADDPFYSIYEQFEDLRQQNDTESLKKLLDEVAGQDGVEVTEQNWEGIDVYSITFNDDYGTSIVHIARDDFRIVGTENSFDDNGITGSFKEVTLEESYSDTEPDFSTDGLMEIGDAAIEFDEFDEDFDAAFEQEGEPSKPSEDEEADDQL